MLWKIRAESPRRHAARAFLPVRALDFRISIGQYVALVSRASRSGSPAACCAGFPGTIDFGASPSAREIPLLLATVFLPQGWFREAQFAVAFAVITRRDGPVFRSRGVAGRGRAALGRGRNSTRTRCYGRSVAWGFAVPRTCTYHGWRGRSRCWRLACLRGSLRSSSRFPAQRALDPAGMNPSRSRASAVDAGGSVPPAGNPPR